MTGVEIIRLVSETVLGIILGLALSVPVHEFGHFAGGMLSGYKFVSMGILGMELVRDGSDFRVVKRAGAPIGQCIMMSERMDRSPTMLILGGIAANALAGGMMSLIGALADDPDRMAVLIGAGGMNMALGVINATSSTPTSDAMTFRETGISGGVELYNRLMCIYGELERGKDIKQISCRYLVPNVWKEDRKIELNRKEYYNSTLAAELMYYRYLKMLRNFGSEDPARMEKELKMIGHFSGALRLLGHELGEAATGGEG